MFERKGITVTGVVKAVVGAGLLISVFFVDRIWDFFRETNAFVLENDGATLGDKFLIFIAIAVFFIFLEVNEIKRNLKR